MPATIAKGKRTEVAGMALLRFLRHHDQKIPDGDDARETIQ